MTEETLEYKLLERLSKLSRQARAKCDAGKHQDWRKYAGWYNDILLELGDVSPELAASFQTIECSTLLSSDIALANVHPELAAQNMSMVADRLRELWAAVASYLERSQEEAAGAEAQRLQLEQAQASSHAAETEDRFNVLCPISHFRRTCDLTAEERASLSGEDARHTAFAMFDFDTHDAEVEQLEGKLLKEYRIHVVRADKEAGLGKKFCKICRCVLASDFGVAFLVPPQLNENVLVEIGYMLGRNKRVIYLVDTRRGKPEAIPFNLSDEMVIAFNTRDELWSGLQRELPGFLSALKLHGEGSLPVDMKPRRMSLEEWMTSGGIWKETEIPLHAYQVEIGQYDGGADVAWEITSKFPLPERPVFGLRMLTTSPPFNQTIPPNIEIRFGLLHSIRLPGHPGERPALLQRTTSGWEEVSKAPFVLDSHDFSLQIAASSNEIQIWLSTVATVWGYPLDSDIVIREAPLVLLGTGQTLYFSLLEPATPGAEP